MEEFYSISYLPDGSIYDRNKYLIEDIIAACPDEIKKYITLDSKRRKATIASPIGDLEFVWTGSPILGASTILKDGVTVNAGLYLPGSDKEQEEETLRYFLEQWKTFEIVKELSQGNIDTLFDEVLSITNRPLACTINWATLEKHQYDKIAYYDLFIGAAFFNVL